MKQYRGRLSGGWTYATMSVLNSVAQIAAKYNIDSELLLDAFAEAWAHDKSKCENLEIECRRGSQGSSVILITCGNKVVWQFPVEGGILEKPEAFKRQIPFISSPASKTMKSSTERHICDLRTGMKGVIVAGEVREVPIRTLVFTRYGFEANVSNILLADKTGSIRLSLWDKQIDSVAVGDTVNVENASAHMFRGRLQLRLGKSGKMNVDTSTRELAVA